MHIATCGRFVPTFRTLGRICSFVSQTRQSHQGHQTQLEVEKKFQPTPEVLRNLNALVEKAHTSLLIDTYFDDDSCSLTTNDFWLRKRSQLMLPGARNMQPVSCTRELREALPVLSASTIDASSSFELKYPSDWGQPSSLSTDTTIDAYREIDGQFEDIVGAASKLIDKPDLSPKSIGTVVSLRQTITMDPSQVAPNRAYANAQLSVVVDVVAFTLDHVPLLTARRFTALLILRLRSMLLSS